MLNLSYIKAVAFILPSHADQSREIFGRSKGEGTGGSGGDGLGLEAAADLLQVRIPRGDKGRPGRVRDGLARQEGLIQGIDETAVLDHTVIQMRPRRNPSGAHVSDHVPLRDPGSPADSLPEPGKVAIDSLVVGSVAQDDTIAVPAFPTRKRDHSIGHGPDRCAGGSGIIHG